jgi:hypothetical protein
MGGADVGRNLYDPEQPNTAVEVAADGRATVRAGPDGAIERRLREEGSR